MNANQPNLPRHRALLIGIDEYKNPGFRPLRGCKNDVQLMQQLLTTKLGFLPEDVQVLTDQQATRDAILGAMSRLSEQVRSDDIIVMFYAGHGSRMRDREGTKPTNWDETLVPVDSGRAPARNRDITDDELRLWLLDLVQCKPYVTLIFDCCHSGTMTRGAELEGRSGPEDLRPVSALPPSPILPKRRAELAAGEIPVDILPPCDRYVVLSACRDEEQAHEYRVPATAGQPEVVHGAFSFFLAQALEIAASGGSVRSYRDAFEYAALRVTAQYGQQHPRIEGAQDRAVFGATNEPRQRGVAVVAQEGELITLYAGAAHGLFADSLWRLSPRDLQLDGKAPVELGQARILSVCAGVARARLDGPVRALPIPCRATELGSGSEARRWSVRSEPKLDALADLLRESPWLRAATDSERPQLKAVRRSTGSGAAWVLQDDEGAIIGSPLVDRSDRDTLLALRDQLEQYVRAMRVRGLGNPRSALLHAVGFQLLRHEPPTTWQPTPRDAAGDYKAAAGTCIALDLRNRSTEPLYLAVLVVGMDCSIAQIYPPLGAPAQRLEPKRCLRVGAWRLRLANLLALPGLPVRSSGVDTLKVLLTSTEVDYQALLQTGVRGEPAVSRTHPLLQQLHGTMTGVSGRMGEDGGAAQDWTSLDVPVTIHG